jgi:K+-transporting ATPase ATPase B chain
VDEFQRSAPADLQAIADRVSNSGATPLAISVNGDILGIVVLSDTLKPGIRERMRELHKMAIRTIMVTGDNPITARAIAAEAGVGEFVAEIKPEEKLNLVLREQREGRMVAMTGDGTNDAPALAQADVGLAMHSGTMAAKEAANLVDLDSDPTKLTDLVAIGKQMLITRGALTTFSIANDVAKYFAIIPAMFIVALPGLTALNVMGLATPQSAILSALIFNALIIPLLIPLALRGVRFRVESAANLFSRNLWIYGVGGLIAPFIGIKLIALPIAPLLLRGTRHAQLGKWRSARFASDIRALRPRLPPFCDGGRTGADVRPRQRQPRKECRRSDHRLPADRTTMGRPAVVPRPSVGDGESERPH